MSKQNNHAWVKGASPILWVIFFFGFNFGPWGSLVAMLVAILVLMGVVAVIRG